MPDGTRHRLSGTVKTKSEAERTLSRLSTDIARGDFAVSSDTTVADYIRPWHAGRKAGVSAKYAMAQHSLIERHIIPGIGQLPLTSVTPRILDAFYSALTHKDPRRKDTLGKPIGDSMRRQTHNTLHLMFNQAVLYGELVRNPADVVRPKYTRAAAQKQEQEQKQKAWSPREASLFKRVARADRLGSIFVFMCASGLRIGEALGLRWSSVNLATGTVHIREAVVSLGGRLHRTSPKTPQSHRTIKVSGDALEILREWRERPMVDREALGERYVPSDAVFTNTKGGPMLPDTVYNGLRRLCAKAGVPYLGTHACRHTFVSIHGANGTPVEIISAHVGHARPSFTLDRYRSVFMHERQDLTLEIDPSPEEIDDLAPGTNKQCDDVEPPIPDEEEG